MRKYRIVAVDDSTIVLKMVERVLSDKYEVYPFTDGMKALIFMENKAKKPDLIILDIEMPGVDGYMVLDLIRMAEHLKDVPVIFLTSNKDKEDVIKAFSNGAKDYIVKPVSEKTLLDKIQSLLKRR